jgi:hypothetical protein
LRDVWREQAERNAERGACRLSAHGLTLSVNSAKHL